MRLKNSVCIVTGAGKGIGKETAKLFYKEGAHLALITRSENDLVLLKDELKGLGRVFTFKGDVSEERSVKSFIKQVLKEFRTIDVLINNAGMRFRKSFLSITTEEWNKVIQNNLNSVYLLSREVGKFMVENKNGKIVNISSVVGTLGLPELTAYGASKGAIITFTKCLALEWAEYNINVNAIAPGFCETSYTEKFKQNKDLYQFTLERTPKKKWGKASDVANACLFLSTKESDYVTGEVLNVDGGWSSW